MYFTINILASYNNNNGTASIVCENTSGVGASSAPIIKDKNNTIFRFPDRKAELIRPNFAKTVITNGSSNIKPNDKRNATTKETYSLIENSGCKLTVEKLIKNLIPAGITKK